MTDLSTLDNPPGPIVTESSLRKAGELFQLGNLAEAAGLCADLLKVRPDYFDAIHLLAVIRLQQGQCVEGAKLIARAIKLNPKDPTVWNNHGHALRELERRDEALGCYDNAIALTPDYAEAHFSRGVLLRELGRLAESVESYDRAIAIKPNYAAAHNNRGNVLKRLGRFAEALISYDQAIACDPGFADAYNNKAVVLQRLERRDEALAHYDRAIAIKSTYWMAFNNRGVCLQEAKRLREALVDYDRAIALKPDYGDAFKNRAFSKLMLGQYREGWLDHEWRWQAYDFPSNPPNCDAPIWQDQDLAGRHLLVFAEQGFGDIIQFSRYLNLLADWNCKKSFLVPAPLLRLIQKSMPAVNVVGELGNLKDIDYQVPLMSLPHRLGTDEGSIPSTVPYLIADAGLQEQWKRRLGAGALKVGIAWSGNPAHQNDHIRSIGFKRLLEAVDLKGVTLVSLQKEVCAEDLPLLDQRKEMLHFGDELRDFSDTAALISLLDLVISVDTSIVHLAGAMGKPVWTLLPYVPDWRWLLDREDSPWYPTMRLFRQEQHDDWTAVLSRVKRELLQIVLWMRDAGSFQRTAPKTTLTKSSLNKLDELSLAIRLHEGVHCKESPMKQWP